MNLLHQVRVLYRHHRRRLHVRLVSSMRKKHRAFLAMPVDRAPDPKTLDSLGQERLQTHVRTRANLH